MKKILIINQPINNRGDETAHKALVRSILKEMPNVVIEVLFIGKKQDSVSQFDVKNFRTSYVNISPKKGWLQAWAEKVIEKPAQNMLICCRQAKDVADAGLYSKVEADRMLKFYMDAVEKNYPKFIKYRTENVIG